MAQINCREWGPGKTLPKKQTYTGNIFWYWYRERLSVEEINQMLRAASAAKRRPNYRRSASPVMRAKQAKLALRCGLP